MKGADAAILAYVVGLGLMLGYALAVWNAGRRAARRAERAGRSDARPQGRE